AGNAAAGDAGGRQGDRKGQTADGDGGGVVDDRRQSIKLTFHRLPGTAAEAASVGALLDGARVLTGAHANKDALRALAGPAILHLATHGFFLSKPAGEEAAGNRGFDLVADTKPRLPNIHNPLLRSGLALSGANRRRGGNQGVLSALEASGLDLQGSRLVVLSACETGVGEVRQDEGVYGLRRAFVMAGAEALVMSLWKVNDDATRALMVAFYEHLKQGQGRREALRQAQLSLMANQRTAHPHYWAGFILSGAWSPLGEPARQVEVPAVKPSVRGCGCRVAGGAPSAPVGGDRGEMVWLALALLLCRRRLGTAPKQQRR
ncbi:MAG TPA: CHAT domain-containing protein, partial [Sorangium sp.]|nr:CHAT domain-containing protein [Sorangium sp.]